MSTYDRPFGTGTGGLYVDGNPFTTTDANQVKICIDKQSLGVFVRGMLLAGTTLTGIDVNADGDVDLYEVFPPEDTDNTSSHLSGFTDTNGATLVVRARFAVRVSNATISATPKLRYGTTPTTMTTVVALTGAAACSATNSDYSGANQLQTVTFTLPAGVNFWKPQLTIASTGGNPYTVWGRAKLDLFIQNTI